MSILNRNAKVLVVRFSSMGDIVLCSPIIRCVREQMKCRVDFLTKHIYKDLLQYNHHIHQVHTFEKDWTEINKSLYEEKYDLIIDLHRNLRSFRLKAFLNTHSISFDKLNIRKWMLVNFKIDLLPEKHLVDRYFDSLSHLGIRNDGKGLDFFIPDNVSCKMLNRYPFILNSNYCVISLGGSYYTKQIPVSLCERLIDRLDDKIVLIGGKDVMESSKHLALRYGDRVVNATGTCTVTESAVFMRYANHVFTGDTGMMHICAALRTQMTVVWGSTMSKFGMYPYYGKETPKATQAEVKNLPCRPCSKLGKSKCPKKHFYCMTQISAEQVISTMKSTSFRN